MKIPSRRVLLRPLPVLLTSGLLGLGCTGSIIGADDSVTSTGAGSSSTGTAGGGGGPGAATCQVGPSELHRLNAVEYDHTVQDLLGITSQPSTKFNVFPIGVKFFNDAPALAGITSPDLDKFIDVGAEVSAEAVSQHRSAFVSCDPNSVGREACTSATLAALAKRAYRRPVTTAEMLGLEAIASAGVDFDEGLTRAINAILVSPSFWFRAIESKGAAGTHALSGYELASRLSYFIWASMPDDKLLAAAEAGTLGDQAVLTQQVDRMLASPKAGQLIEQFASQWLELSSRFQDAHPKADLFPQFDDSLKSSMGTEARLFLNDFVQNGKVTDLLLSTTTHVDARLASYYGIGGVSGTDFQTVSLAGTPRQGFLTVGATLTMTSSATATNVPRRGNWVLTNLMCAEVPAPPNDIILDTQVKRLESPQCVGCHGNMDPIGLAMEQFDAVGRYRTTDETGAPITAEGKLPTGEMFTGVKELSTLLAGDSRYSSCVVTNLVTYAIGRELAADTEGCIAAIVKQSGGNDARFTDLVRQVVLSEIFRSSQQKEAQL